MRAEAEALRAASKQNDGVSGSNDADNGILYTYMYICRYTFH
jgi:hypothetical protein